MTLRIVGISGSLRRASFNSALLRAAQSEMPAHCELVIHSIAKIPLYDGDVEDNRGLQRMFLGSSVACRGKMEGS